jgi:hypothetical protein
VNTSDLLSAHDRCPRAAHWSQSWESNLLHPNEALRRAIEEALLHDGDDPGQYAGDSIMTMAAERGLDTSGNKYECAMHNAALADIIVTVLRSGGPWARPEDRKVKSFTWVSGVFVEPSGTRLSRVICVDRWNDERKLSEMHAWRTLGEQAAYGLPMTLTVVLVGQRREGRHHSPWSKGFLHPRSRNLRIAKRSGEKFDGNWIQCWREEQENISRDKWLDAMRADGVMHDVLFDVEVPAPDPAFMSKIGRLAERKMEAITGAKEIPPPNISVCDWPTKCQFATSCWEFTEPSERTGFIAIT